MSFVPLYRITNRMTAGLTQIERARGVWVSFRLLPVIQYPSSRHPPD